MGISTGRSTALLIAGGIFFFSALAPVNAQQTVSLNDKKIAALDAYAWDLQWKKFLTPGELASPSAPEPDAVLNPLTIWNGKKMRGETASSFGFATYHLRVKTDLFPARLAVRLTAPLTSYRIFINGEKTAEVGTLTESRKNFTGQRRSGLFFFSQKNPELDIVVHVANFMHYKGGLRGTFELGRAEDMQAFGMRYLAADLFAIGVIFSIMLYHLLIYLLTRKDRSTLVFAILAFNYFLLAFFFGEQSISLFLPDLPLELHLRLGAFFTYILPPILLQFTALLFPGILHRRIIRAYWLLAVVFSLLLTLPAVYFTAYNVLYYGGVGISSGVFCFWIAVQAFREKRPGASLLLLGLVFLFSLTIYAIFLVWTHSLAGSFLSIGFCLFALFQSGSLAHSHAALNRHNVEMQVRLERSRLTLENQRKQIEANLHDSLGGNLTDIKLGLEALERKTTARGAKADLKKLDARVGGTIASLRTELLFLEDLQLTMKDFISGINLILLRRYQMAKRRIDIQISAATRDHGKLLETKGILSEELKLELCMIIQEICNNNLKYGTGTPEWSITATRDLLQIGLKSPTRHRMASTGLGYKTLRERVGKIRGNFSESVTGKNYSAELVLRW